jgi:carboxymethylenebutenolidase
VLVMFHRGGIDEFTRYVCRRLAQNGYVAAAPNLYHRRPKGEESGESITKVLDAELVADIRAAHKAVEGMPGVRADRIGIVGHCFGGRNSLYGAATIPSIRACAMFYGGNLWVARGEGRKPPIESVKNVACPVMGFFGNEDRNPSPSDVDKLDELLTRHGKTHMFHRYDGAGHAFLNFLNAPSFREKQAEDAWAKFLVFLDRELKYGEKIQLRVS